MIRPAIMMWIALAVLGAAALFFVKFEVQTLDEQLAALNTEKRAHEEAIHVLSAEWSYLNRPERLARLAERHLDLAPATPWQVIDRAQVFAARDLEAVQ